MPATLPLGPSGLGTSAAHLALPSTPPIDPAAGSPEAVRGDVAERTGWLDVEGGRAVGDTGDWRTNPGAAPPDPVRAAHEQGHLLGFLRDDDDGTKRGALHQQMLGAISPPTSAAPSSTGDLIEDLTERHRQDDLALSHAMQDMTRLQGAEAEREAQHDALVVIADLAAALNAMAQSNLAGARVLHQQALASRGDGLGDLPANAPGSPVPLSAPQPRSELADAPTPPSELTRRAGALQRPVGPRSRPGPGIDPSAGGDQAATNRDRQPLGLPPAMNVTTAIQLIPGTTVSLGEIACGTTARINPAYPTIYEGNAAWVAKFVPFGSREAMIRFLECRCPMWDCMCFPDGIAERVLHSSCTTSLLFEVDDIAVVERAVFDRVSTLAATGHPYGPAFADLHDTYKREMPDRVFRRFRAAWQRWFVEVLEENRYRRALRTPALAEYLQLRRLSVGLLPYVVAIEYFLGLDLTDVLEADPELGSLGEAAVEHALLVNDLLSFRVEAFRGDPINIVALLLRTQPGSLQKAVDTTVGLIRDADRTLADLSGRLRARHPDPAVRAYIDAVNAFSAGNLRWSLETTRYIGHGNAWTGMRSGDVTMDAQRTTMRAAETIE